MNASSADGIPRIPTEAFCLGFVVGQVAAYCEQVRAGSKLAAQIGCSRAHVGRVREQIDSEQCRFLVEERTDERVAVWIFKDDYVLHLIREFSEKATPPSAAGVWAMGKLFGYSDAEIGSYLSQHGLIR